MNNINHQISLRVGSRGSQLALIQVEEIRNLLADKNIYISFQSSVFQTRGDKDKVTSLTANAGDDFFTDALDSALLKNEIDIAIHSAKDLPQNLHPDLTVFALTKTIDDTDAFVGKVNFFQLKSGAKVGTSSLVRQSSLKELNPNILCVDIRGTIQERLKLVEQGQCDGVIVATAALKRLGLAHLIKDIMPWEATALQGQLAVVGRCKDAQLKNLFLSIDVRRLYGSVILVGAGPGDSKLITLKGIEALQRADVVFYDYLMDPVLLEYAPLAEHIYVGKRKGNAAMSQKDLCKALRQKSIEGKQIVRLKGGDPLIFGRGAEEISYLQSFYIPVEVVPGVSSATAIPASLNLPLTARGVSSSVAFISGHEEAEDQTQPKPIRIPNVETIVFLMGLTKLDLIVQALRAAHWGETTPMIIISKGTRVDEKIVVGTIATIQEIIKKESMDPPALIIVGNTVNFFKWDQYQKMERILFLGTNPQQYHYLGRIIHFPVIHIEEAPINLSQAQTIVEKLPTYDFILLTSKFAVEYFFKFLKRLQVLQLGVNNKKFIVIGHHTAQALEQEGIAPDLISDIETSEGLLARIQESYQVKDKLFLFPRSSLPNPFLKSELKKKGAQVDEITIYQNVKLPKRSLPKEVEKVVFTSPSTVKNFLEDYGDIPKQWIILSKGPLTSRYLKEAGYESVQL